MFERKLRLLAEDTGKLVLEHCPDKVLLGVEVVVELALAGVCRRQHVVEARPANAALVHPLRRRPDDGFSGLAAALGPWLVHLTKRS